ncbi:unnamed protein product [Lepidochelys kempii]
MKDRAVSWSLKVKQSLDTCFYKPGEDILQTAPNELCVESAFSDRHIFPLQDVINTVVDTFLLEVSQRQKEPV